MKALDTVRLQLSAPYTVVQEGEEYLFRSDSDILYAVSFQAYNAIEIFCVLLQKIQLTMNVVC